MLCPKCHRHLELKREYDEALQDYIVGFSCCGFKQFEQMIYTDAVSADFLYAWDDICRMYEVLQDFQSGETVGSSMYHAFCVCMKALGLALVPESFLNEVMDELHPPMEELVDDKYWTPPEFLCEEPRGFRFMALELEDIEIPF